MEMEFTEGEAKKGQIGRVMSLTEDNRATIMIERHTSCKKCGVCNLGMLRNNEKTVEVTNTVNASTGDFVLLGVKSGAVLKASFILYMIPLFALVAGLIGGNIWAEEIGMEPDVLSVLLGLPLMILAFIVIRLYDNSIRNKETSFNPYIIRIADEEEAKEMIGEEDLEEDNDETHER